MSGAATGMRAAGRNAISTPELQEKIQEFKKAVGRLAERRGQQKEVYQLAIALYPLTKLEEEK